MFPKLITQFYSNLSIAGVPTLKSLFLSVWGGNIEFEFCTTMEKIFNRVIPFITHPVLLRTFMRRLEILLTCSRHQGICSALSCILYCNLC